MLCTVAHVALTACIMCTALSCHQRAGELTNLLYACSACWLSSSNAAPSKAKHVHTHAPAWPDPRTSSWPCQTAHLGYGAMLWGGAVSGCLQPHPYHWAASRGAQCSLSCGCAVQPPTWPSHPFSPPVLQLPFPLTSCCSSVHVMERRMGQGAIGAQEDR